MSSDSEEEFQSADEFSEDDFSESSQIVQNNTENINLKEKEASNAPFEGNSLKGDIPPEILDINSESHNHEILTQDIDKSLKEFNLEKERVKVAKEKVDPIILDDNSSSMPNPIEKAEDTDIKNLTHENTSKLEKDSENNEKSVPKMSKIGLKKPRERISDRLGTKKLGVRQVKPLVGISHATFKNKEESEATLSPSNKETEEKLQKQKQWETQQQLWNNVTDKEDSSSGWNSWGGWGTSLLTAASTITSEVGKGVATVLETVEGSLGAPDPNVLAEEAVKREQEALKGEVLAHAEESVSSHKDAFVNDSKTTEQENQPNYSFPNFGGLGSLVTGVSGAIETASNKVLLGGLDTLEMIGRKTMDVLQEGDPRLVNTRSLVKGRPNLSKILEEARLQNTRDEGDTVDGSPTKENEMKHVSFLQIWDATEGPAHLEALSLVAKQCQSRTSVLSQALSPVIADKLQKNVVKIKAYSELENEIIVEDVLQNLDTICSEMTLTLNFSKLLSSWQAFRKFTTELNKKSTSYDSKDVELFILERDLYTAAAGFMNQVVGFLHKAAEVALIQTDLDVIKTASQFQSLCSCISQGFEKVSDEICGGVSAQDTPDTSTHAFITNVFLQMAEGNGLLEQSLKLLGAVFIQIQTKEFAEFA